MSEPISNGGHAFPINAEDWRDIPNHPSPGMTLRDYFAARAPAAPAWWWSQQDKSENASVADMARWNYVWADEMLKAREAK